MKHMIHLHTNTRVLIQSTTISIFSLNYIRYEHINIFKLFKNKKYKRESVKRIGMCTFWKLFQHYFYFYFHFISYSLLIIHLITKKNKKKTKNEKQNKSKKKTKVILKFNYTLRTILMSINEKCIFNSDLIYV